MNDMQSRITGGMAMRNGIVFITDDYVIKSIYKDNEIIVKKKQRLVKRFSFLSKIPIIGMIISYLEVAFTAYPIYFSTVFSILVYSLITGNNTEIVLPYDLEKFLIPLIFVALVLNVKLTQKGKYHSAEHMANTAMRTMPIVSLNAIKVQSRLSEYCGSMLMTNMILMFFILSSIPFIKHGYIPEDKWMYIISGSVVVGIMLNQFRMFKSSKIILKPFDTIGFFLQKHLFTTEPDEIHLKVAYEGVKEVYGYISYNRNNVI